MRRHPLLLCAVCLPVLSAALAPSARGDASPEKPNVLLIMADDVGREALGCYGGTSYQTPHLDALAAGGIRFDHCYSMPVCHPTRLTIMTGRYPFRNPAGWGRWPTGVETFAHVLKRAGYATAVAGKWQLVLLKQQPDHARQLGFDESALFGWHEGPPYHNPLIYRNGVIWKAVRKPEVCGPDVYTDFLIDFTDLLPTLAELARAELPEGVPFDGRSFAPRLRDQAGNPREWVFCQHRGRQFVRTHQWKLYNDGRLFDLRRDRREMHPIDRAAQSPPAAAARQRLQKVLTDLELRDQNNSAD
jgi:arylsulfatase A-like enzyme